MPNWCHNTLTVKGEQNALSVFVEAAKLRRDVAEKLYAETVFVGDTKPELSEFADRRQMEQPLSFESFLPIPRGVDWYEWCIEHWSTKWDANFNGLVMAIGAEGMDLAASAMGRGVTITPEVVVYKFDTAWSPPLLVVVAMSEQHPELEFVLRFAEVGHEVAGESKWVAGLLLFHQDLSIGEVLMPEEMWF